MKTTIPLKKICCLTMAIAIVLGIAFYMIARQQLSYKEMVAEPPTPSGNVGELIAGDVVEQSFTTQGDVLRQISLLFYTYNRFNSGTLLLRVFRGAEMLYETAIDVSSLTDSAYVAFPVDLNCVDGEVLTLQIMSEDGAPGNAVTLASGNSINVGKVDVLMDAMRPAVKNGQALGGMLCLRTIGIETLWLGQYYWYIFAAALILLGIFLARLLWCSEKGRRHVGLTFLVAMKRYRFLLRQLINRDFKTKYKRNVLGVFWSFLNPLLTMTIQYLVFSTLFKSDVPNYPAYLLAGIVCFSFFNESVSQCLTSITGNAGLITKVYVPKYIYPLSKTLSSGINLLLSLIPLLIVVFITGLRIHVSILLLPFGLICLFMFSLGMGMLLATSMVFFRDTMFLWGVFSMLWMYCTPIFYPETIIPARLMPLFKMNPLYHIIRFIRITLINGVSPEPKAYLFCMIACTVPLLLGLWVFKKNQDKFVLYV